MPLHKSVFKGIHSKAVIFKLLTAGQCKKSPCNLLWDLVHTYMYMCNWNISLTKQNFLLLQVLLLYFLFQSLYYSSQLFCFIFPGWFWTTTLILWTIHGFGKHFSNKNLGHATCVLKVKRPSVYTHVPIRLPIIFRTPQM